MRSRQCRGLVPGTLGSEPPFRHLLARCVVFCSRLFSMSTLVPNANSYHPRLPVQGLPQCKLSKCFRNMGRGREGRYDLLNSVVFRSQSQSQNPSQARGRGFLIPVLREFLKWLFFTNPSRAQQTELLPFPQSWPS